jgi:hypothetical protein
MQPNHHQEEEANTNAPNADVTPAAAVPSTTDLAETSATNQSEDSKSESVFEGSINLERPGSSTPLFRDPFPLSSGEPEPSSKDQDLEYRRKAADTKTEQILSDGLRAHKEIQDLIGIARQDKVELQFDGSKLTTVTSIPNEQFPFELTDLTWLVLTIPNRSMEPSIQKTKLYGHIQEQSAVANAITQNLQSPELKLYTWEKVNVRVFASATQNVLVFPADLELLNTIVAELTNNT